MTIWKQKQRRLGRRTGHFRAGLRVEALEDRRLLALGPEFLKDVNNASPGSVDAEGGEIIAMGDVVYFRADDGIHGSELWRSDGTEGGTWMVKDIVEGPTPSRPHTLLRTGNRFLFTINKANGFKSLWVSDGTEQGTVVLQDLRTTVDPLPFMGAWNDVVFFPFQSMLWRSDGTARGTYGIGSEGGTIVAAENRVFVAGLKNNLYVSDGTSEGTLFVKAFGDHQIIDPTVVGNSVFFQIGDTSLWVSDGTEAGTVLVTDLNPGRPRDSLHLLTSFNGALYFRAETNGEEDAGLWTSDGTPSGTHKVADVVPYGHSSERSMVVFNEHLAFTGSVASSPLQFYVSDGTAEGTRVLQDGVGPPNIRLGQSLSVSMGGFLYFQRFTDLYGFELWRTDLTDAGTTLVRDIRVGRLGAEPHTLVVADDELFFYAYDHFPGRELWKSDGTSTGTVLVRDISSDTYPSHASQFISLGNQLVFVADDGPHKDEPWRTDGTAAGTTLVSDLRSGLRSSYPEQLTRVGNRVFFVALTTTGTELWRTDGTRPGTRLVRDLNPGQYSSYIRELANVGDKLYFQLLGHAAGGPELWRSDGSDSGTVLVKDFESFTPETQGNESLYVMDITDVSGIAYFTFDDPEHGRELWTSDGTGAGTVMVKDILPGPLSSLVETDRTHKEMTVLNGILYFVANDGQHGKELWRSDGTVAGTVMVEDIRLGTASSNPTGMVVMNGALYFSASDGEHGSELWRSDGTPDGTTMVTDIRPGSLSSHPGEFLVVDDILYFTAESDSGDELWRSNGTEEGTWLIHDVARGAVSSRPEQLASAGKLVYFLANDGSHGTQIWRTAGTADTTLMVTPYAFPSEDAPEPALPWSEPNDLNALCDRLIFSGNHPIYDNELWVVNQTVSANVAPVLDASVEQALDAIDEDAVANRGNRVADLLRGADGGIVVSDTDVGQFTGIAVTHVDNAHGRWQFSHDDGGSWFDFGSPSDAAARLLVADYRTRVRFVPEANFFGPIADGIAIRAWDGSAGYSGGIADARVSGGATSFSAGIETASILVREVNDPPIANPDVVVIKQGQGSVLIDVLANDSTAPEPEETLRILELSQPAQGAVELTSETGPIRFAIGDEFFGRFTFTYTLADSRDATAIGTVEVIVTPPGDTNFDGQVDLADLNNVRNHFGETGNVLGDTDGDQDVDLDDLNAVRNNFGVGAPSPALPSMRVGSIASRGPLAFAPARERLTRKDESRVAVAARDALFRKLDEPLASMPLARSKQPGGKLAAFDRVFAELSSPGVL